MLVAEHHGRGMYDFRRFNAARAVPTFPKLATSRIALRNNPVSTHDFRDMWNTVIAGLFALAGVAFGVAAEPFKAAVSSRSRTRQARGEQCAKLISATTATRHGVIALNAAGRAICAGHKGPEPKQVNGWITEINDARSRGREASALLDLYGPLELAKKARKVLEAEESVYLLMDEPDPGEHDLMKKPPQLIAATDALDVVVQEFAQQAHKFTR
ncbi:hypothetical protein [Amycolatopsis sp. lyj-90]|uniref:hypothetical protein n=1 Tax=Amycolatopsis sp. lyj-90 TaxID=2789285 RepID=UPI00397BC6B6